MWGGGDVFSHWCFHDSCVCAAGRGGRKRISLGLLFIEDFLAIITTTTTAPPTPAPVGHPAGETGPDSCFFPDTGVLDLGGEGGVNKFSSSGAFFSFLFQRLDLRQGLEIGGE